ncbi:hypothetical protein [Kitasatospora viridis]|uniref:hypothetical protein n=1 Tax=Kitasatospora viridis TaxID=281105 RepID=UPI0011A7C7CE|nr:hypothetical protein [Kitasatospora viridis]
MSAESPGSFGPTEPEDAAPADDAVREVLIRFREAATDAPSDEAKLHLLDLVAREMTARLGRFDRETLVTWREVGCQQDSDGKSAAAVHLLSQVVTDMAQELGPADPDTLVAHLELATAIGNSGDPRAAMQRFQELLPALTAVHGAYDARVLTVQVRLAANQAKAGDVLTAVQQLQGLIPWLQQNLPVGHPLVGEARCALARLVPTFRHLTGTPNGTGLGPIEAVAMVHRLLVWDFASDAEAKTCMDELGRFTGKKGIASRLTSVPENMPAEQAAAMLLA